MLNTQTYTSTEYINSLPSPSILITDYSWGIIYKGLTQLHKPVEYSQSFCDVRVWLKDKAIVLVSPGESGTSEEIVKFAEKIAYTIHHKILNRRHANFFEITEDNSDVFHLSLVTHTLNFAYAPQRHKVTQAYLCNLLD